MKEYLGISRLVTHSVDPENELKTYCKETRFVSKILLIAPKKPTCLGCLKGMKVRKSMRKVVTV